MFLPVSLDRQIPFVSLGEPILPTPEFKSPVVNSIAVPTPATRRRVFLNIAMGLR
jgi:hypothetical protein